MKAQSPPTIPTEDRWVSQPELRRLLAYSATTVRRFRQRGLPCVGQNRLRRYHLPTVLHWLSKHA